MCLLPFVVITLRSTIFQKTDVRRAEEFLASEKPYEKILVCMGGQCPNLGIRTIKLSGTHHEIHSAFLSILLQVNTDQTKIVVSAPKSLHVSIKEILKNINIDYLVIF
jgi:hypothetical protein